MVCYPSRREIAVYQSAMRHHRWVIEEIQLTPIAPMGMIIPHEISHVVLDSALFEVRECYGQGLPDPEDSPVNAPFFSLSLAWPVVGAFAQFFFDPNRRSLLTELQKCPLPKSMAIIIHDNTGPMLLL